MSSAERQQRKVRFGVRRFATWCLRGLAVAAVVFLLFAVRDRYRYGVPLGTAVEGLARQVHASVVRLAIGIYDPCSPRFLPAGPAETADPDGYVRVEHALRSGGGVRVVEVHNGTIVVPDFRFQPSDEPRLAELRRKYRLDEVVAPATDEFGAMVRLRDWARSQFRRNDYQPGTANFDALEVLDRGRRGHGEPLDQARYYDPCHFYPMFYCQLAVAMGHQARLMSVGHGLAEVWSNQFDRWVVMDAELSHHFEKDGVPLNTAEVMDETFATGPTRIRLVPGHVFGGENPALAFKGVQAVTAEMAIPWFRPYVILVDRRNDWMTNHYFRGHPARASENSLIYMDPRLDVPPAYGDRLITRDTRSRRPVLAPQPYGNPRPPAKRRRRRTRPADVYPKLFPLRGCRGRDGGRPVGHGPVPLGTSPRRQRTACPSR